MWNNVLFRNFDKFRELQVNIFRLSFNFEGRISRITVVELDDLTLLDVDSKRLPHPLLDPVDLGCNEKVFENIIRDRDAIRALLFIQGFDGAEDHVLVVETGRGIFDFFGFSILDILFQSGSFHD
jgi:hypothetical protein